MTKSCLWLSVAVLLVSATSLFACDDAPPAYFHFKDYPAPHGSTDVAPGSPTYTYPDYFTFRDYTTPLNTTTTVTTTTTVSWRTTPNALPSCPRK
jgi:hypothetical protein